MPTPYHLLVRDDPRHRPWQLPLALIIAIGLFAIAAALVRPGMTDPVTSPRGLAADLGVVTVLGAGLFVGLWMTASPALRLVWSVEGRVRWTWWGRCCAVTFAVVPVVLALASMLPESGIDTELVLPSTTAWAGVLVAVALVPGQALTEELVFRGAVPQLIGTVVPAAWIGVVASTLFYVGIQAQAPWSLVGIAVMSLGAGIMTQRTGGLEAAVALHVADQVVLFVLEAAGAVPTSDARAGLGFTAMIPTVAVTVVVVALVEWQARVSGLVRTRPEVSDHPTVVPPEGRVTDVTSRARIHPRTPGYPGDIGDDWGR